jgi:hypothetical protein
MTKDSPRVPMILETCINGRFKYWEAPKFSHGNPVKRLNFKNSKKTQQEGIKIIFNIL